MSFYETIDKITADAGIRVRAKSLEDLICKSLLATYNEITPIEDVQPKEERVIQTYSELPFLIADLINEAIVLHESELFVASKCEPIEVKKDYAKVKLLGDRFDPERNEPRLVIKAATYHNLKVEREGDLWIAEVIFDI
ncbi:MAG: archease [Aquificaceae bacterium]|nr:archease [Aquificaceae bacterium]MCS7277320.1 archease [Aquificaceae bacterium]MDW8067140.1 archease [Aquificaceae bacterium]MDW8423903.1 archease [Aquificaceae bacterium]